MTTTITIVPGSTRPTAPKLDLAKQYPNGNTVGQVIRFQAKMHSFFMKHGRMPRLEEMTINQKLVWLRMEEEKLTENRYDIVPRWKMGFLLELCIEQYLRNKRNGKRRAVEVHYDPLFDVIYKVDLLIWGKPVQIKGTRTFNHDDGMHYLVIEDFFGSLTQAHRAKIDQFVEWLRGQ